MWELVRNANPSPDLLIKISGCGAQESVLTSSPGDSSAVMKFEKHGRDNWPGD